MKIRKLEARDKAAWLPLFQAYVAFYKARVPDSVIEGTWARLMQSEASNLVGLVVVDEADRPFGIAHLLFHISTWSPTTYCYLEDLFVDPSHRGTGAGRALIEATFSEADRRGATRTYWMTQETNSTARALYDRLASKTPFVQYRR